MKVESLCVEVVLYNETLSEKLPFWQRMLYSEWEFFAPHRLKRKTPETLPEKIGTKEGILKATVSAY